jgi:hypothetical protein
MIEDISKLLRVGLCCVFAMMVGTCSGACKLKRSWKVRVEEEEEVAIRCGAASRYKRQAVHTSTCFTPYTKHASLARLHQTPSRQPATVSLPNC